MRIRTANGFGLVRPWSVLVIVLVVVMSGSAAFGQQQQSGQVKNKKVGAATSKIIKEAPPMRIMTDNSEPGGSNPGGGSGGGVQGGLGHLDVPAPPYFSSPIYINLPSPPNSPSGIGTPATLVLYEDICSCSRTERVTLNTPSEISGLAPSGIKDQVSRLPGCYGGTLASQTRVQNLSYKISDYVTPGAQQSAYFMCVHGTVVSYEYTDVYTYTHCSITDTNNPPNPNPAKFTWTLSSGKSDYSAQMDVADFGRCPW